MKKPWIAAILNVLIFGLGYVYNGKRMGIGVGFMVAWGVVRAGEIAIYLTDLVLDRWLILMGGLVIMQICFGVDAYKEAKAINGNQR